MDSFIHWFSRIDNKILWLLSPVYVWFVKLIFTKLKELESYSSERAAKLQIVALQKALENPPTLLGSVAYIVCFLPLPIALAGMLGALYFAPYPQFIFGPRLPVDPQIAQRIYTAILFLFFLLMYILFAMLAIYGVQVAYRLRHGEARYVENYNAAIQKKIAKLKKKYPNLQ